MNARDPGPVLHDARAPVVGIANEHSIAYGCARAFRELGADLTLTTSTTRQSRTQNLCGQEVVDGDPAGLGRRHVAAGPARLSGRYTFSD